MSYRLNLSKSKMYALMSAVNSNLPELQKCDFSYHSFRYWMSYQHPATGNYIRVSVTPLLGDTIICFRNESKGTDYQIEHFSIQYLMDHGMLREVSA
ncbi:hypothetical protein [Lacrimispora amygdalina]|uniref:hypothetical protein n=1 Tax=Lacrimispora amygdalina TaxID=253257 RepID=UPI000BE425DD|nr:hypothetical protein [Lacrimispora amygdalina]